MTAEANRWVLSARWLLPGDGPPIANGCLTIRAGRIEALGPAAHDGERIDLGNAAILPGLVNAHTHLDLTRLHGQCPPDPRAPFPDWLRCVVRQRRSQAADATAAAVSEGLAESIRSGTTLLGDISAQGLSWPILAAAPIRAVVFHELIGLPRPRAEAALQTATHWLHERTSNGNCRPALSPHAPYSAHAQLFEEAAHLASEHGICLATHLAESPAEAELLSSRAGPFVTFLRELDAWDESGLLASSAEVIHRCASAPHLLLVHANHLSLDTALPSRASLVYCPRTHAAFGHAPYPLGEWLSRGVNVALGTDSRASNPDLDLLAEARFVYAHFPSLDGETILRLATSAGSRALGWDDETGSLAPGKSADVIVVPLPENTAASPYDLVFGEEAPVCAVMCRGRWLDMDHPLETSPKKPNELPSRR